MDFFFPPTSICFLLSAFPSSEFSYPRSPYIRLHVSHEDAMAQAVYDYDCYDNVVGGTDREGGAHAGNDATSGEEIG